jgi:putative spermidine/putrescine transport system substrate-binding protein
VASLRQITGIALSVVVALGAAACGGSNSSDDAAGTVTTKPTKKPSSLVIRVWSGDELKVYADTAAKNFTRDTGIQIKWDPADEAVSYTKIGQQIRNGQRPSDDASLNAQQRAYLSSVRNQTIPISPKLAPNLDKVNPVVAKPEGASDAAWPYVNLYTLSVPFIVRTDKIDPKEVQSWNDLFKPALKRSLVFDTIYSSTAFGLAQSLGVDPAASPPGSLDPVWKRLHDIQPNLAQLGSNADVVTALTNGTVKVAISNTGSGISAKAAGAPVKLVAPRDGLYVVGDSYYIHKGIPAENAYYAQVFANYLLDASVQTAVAAKLGFVPVNPAATVPKYMRDDPRVFPRSPEELDAAKAVIAPIPLMARYDSQWQTSFDNALK